MYGNYCIWGFHWLLGLFFLVLIIWLIARPHHYGYYQRWGHHPMWGPPMSGGHPMWESNKALDILKERYARGEISKEEFEEKKKDLLQ